MQVYFVVLGLCLASLLCPERPVALSWLVLVWVEFLALAVLGVGSLLQPVNLMGDFVVPVLKDFLTDDSFVTYSHPFLLFEVNLIGAMRRLSQARRRVEACTHQFVSVVVGITVQQFFDGMDVAVAGHIL